ACPSGVPFGHLLEATRAQFERRGVRAAATDRKALDAALELFPHPRRVARMMRGLRLYQRSGVQKMIRSLGVLAAFPKLMNMEALLPRLPVSDGAPDLLPARGTRRGRAGLHTGCVQRFLYPDVNRDTARLLSAAGYDVVTPRGQECCGALH